MSLELLIQKCKDEERAAQAQLYKMYADVLFPVCLKYGSSSQDAKDILQDAFLTIFEKINSYNHKGSFEGWMKRITINTALMRYRKTKVFQLDHDIPDEEASDEDLSTSGIPLDYILSCVQELPDRYRIVFNLYVMDDYKHDDIAAMLDISAGTSKSNLSRAKKILKDKLQAYTGTSTATAS